MKTYFARPCKDKLTGGKDVRGRWLLMKRFGADNGGGEWCVAVFEGNHAMLRARRAAQAKNKFPQ